MPIDMKFESMNSGNITSTEAFFDELNNIILKDLPYSADLSKSINDLLSTLE